MKKAAKLIFAFLMVCSVCLGTLASTPVLAAENTKKAVFSIDAGRKYFSEEQLKGIIEKAYLNGYTDVQLILGNDGFRFLLDDMTIETVGKTYTSNDVKEAIKAGNVSYYDDPNGNVLTEEEMNRIVAYAKERDMNLIPVFNSPGHMTVLLSAMTDLGITDAAYVYPETQDASKTTVDVANTDAIAFVKAVMQKYVDYFANTGVVEIFNFGADEYAQDVIPMDMTTFEPAWKGLIAQGLYDEFVEYINGLSAMIKAAGLTPMCFSDGIYYDFENAGVSYDCEIDTDIIVSFWVSGFGKSATPAQLASKGFKIMNTNRAWYWVVGMMTKEDYDYYYLGDALAGIENKNFNTMADGSEDIEIIGSTQAVWCDKPEMEYDEDVLFQLMDAFSAKYADYMPRPADYTAVKEALQEVPAGLNVYTNESVEALQAAINSVIYNQRVDKQETVDGYATAIKNALAQLQFKSADYTKVDEALSKVPSDLSKYTDASVKVLNDAINSVVRDKNINEQEVVDGYATAITDAISKLEVKATTPTTPTAPKTGDSTNVVLPFLMLGVSFAVVIYGIRKKQF